MHRKPTKVRGWIWVLPCGGVSIILAQRRWCMYTSVLATAVRCSVCHLPGCSTHTRHAAVSRPCRAVSVCLSAAAAALLLLLTNTTSPGETCHATSSTTHTVKSRSHLSPAPPVNISLSLSQPLPLSYLADGRRGDVDAERAARGASADARAAGAGITKADADAASRHTSAIMFLNPCAMILSVCVSVLEREESLRACLLLR